MRKLNTFILCGLLGAATITATAQTFTVGDFAALKAQIAAYGPATNDMIIEVSASFSITAVLSIPANASGKTLTIRSANASSPVTLTRGFLDTGNFNGLLSMSTAQQV